MSSQPPGATLPMSAVESPWLFVWVISIILRHTRQGQGEGDNWLQESPLARVAYMDDLEQQ